MQRIGDRTNEHHTLAVALTASVACHVLVFGGLVYVPGDAGSRFFPPSVINVSLVSLPPLGSETNAGRKTDPGAISKTVPAKGKSGVKADPSAPGKFRRKTSLKKKTFRPSRVVKQAISKIERQIGHSRAEPIQEAIDGLRKTVQDTEAAAADAPGERVSAPLRGSGTQGRRALEQMDIYKAEIPYHIQNNWVFSEQLAGGRTDLVARLVIKIRPDGAIRDIWFEKRSGNRYFDEQAFKAIKKSDPLPPLPKSYVHPFFNVGLRFTPSGLR